MDLHRLRAKFRGTLLGVAIGDALGAPFEGKPPPLDLNATALLATTHAFADVVVTAIRLGGDTDTIAAMAGALAGAWLGEAALPAVWRERVEGAHQLVRLADDLFNGPTAADPPGQATGTVGSG